MIRYMLVALVPDPPAGELAHLRKTHDVFTRQWLPPHITIVPPFDAFLTPSDRRALQSVPASFDVRLGDWGEFRRATTSVLFITAQSEALQAVREDAAERVPAVAPFVPADKEFHVTVVSRIPNEQFDTVKAAVTTQVVRGSFRIERLTLFEWDIELRHWIKVP